MRSITYLPMGAALAALLVLSAAAHCQQETISARGLTLSEAIARALARAPALQGAQASIRAADAARQSAGLLPNPTLSIEVENVLGSGPYSNFGASENTYVVSMPVELNGKRAARVRVAEAELAGTTLSARSAKADLTMRVTQAFVALAAGERRVIAARARQELADQAARAAEIRVKAGKASPIEIQRAEVLRLNASVNAERLDRAVALAAANLGRFIDRPQPIAIAAPWFDDTGKEVGTEMSIASLALATGDAQVSTAAARMDAARRARTPDVTVSVGARRFNESGDTAAVLLVSVPFPWFNRGTEELARATAELDRAKADRDAIALEAEQAVATAQAEVADANASAAAANGPILSAAMETARIARIGYAEGKFSQLDLIDAERSLSETQEAAINSLAVFHETRARLARVLGQTDPIYKE